MSVGDYMRIALADASKGKPRRDDGFVREALLLPIYNSR
jgi:hypothetical protein